MALSMHVLRWSRPVLVLLLAGGVVTSAAGVPPAVELTASQVRVLDTIGEAEFAQRGYGLAFVETASELAAPLPCDAVADHLGTAVPRFPDLAARGFTTVCGSAEGRAVLDHPVPSAADPPPPVEDPAADVHSVTVFYVPPGVDLRRTDFREARGKGLMWLTVSYGGDVAQWGEAPEPTPPDRDDFTTVSFRDGTPLWVQNMAPFDTRLAWVATVADHHLALVLTTSSDPLAGVRLVARGVDLPV